MAFDPIYCTVNPFTSIMMCKHVNILADVGTVGLEYFALTLEVKGLGDK